MNEWISEWMRQSMAFGVQNRIERMNECLNKWVSEWVTERVNEWAVSEWVSEWVRYWLIEWGNDWMSNFMLAHYSMPRPVIPQPCLALYWDMLREAVEYKVLWGPYCAPKACFSQQKLFSIFHGTLTTMQVLRVRKTQKYLWPTADTNTDPLR